MKAALPGQQNIFGAHEADGLAAISVWSGGRWSCVWVILSATTMGAILFAVWDLIQRNYFQALDTRTLHYLYITRGIALAFFFVAWTACLMLVQRRAVVGNQCSSERTNPELIEDARDAIKAFDPQGIVPEKMSSLGQLAAGVAHQLNTPLAAALLRVQMLEEDVQQPEHVEELRFIQRQLRFGQEIVEGLLRFSQTAGETRRAEALNPILQGVVAMLESTARGTGVCVTLDLEKTAGTLVYGGRNELEQVFSHLGRNALDAMPLGGKLMLTTGVVPGRLAEVQVRDTGTGIPEDRLPRIFEPFYTTKAPGQGTGLGLAICRRMLEESGGSIDVTSEVGRGTTFRVRLPISQ